MGKDSGTPSTKSVTLAEMGFSNKNSSDFGPFTVSYKQDPEVVAEGIKKKALSSLVKK